MLTDPLTESGSDIGKGRCHSHDILWGGKHGHVWDGKRIGQNPAQE